MRDKAAKLRQRAIVHANMDDTYTKSVNEDDPNEEFAGFSKRKTGRKQKEIGTRRFCVGGARNFCESGIELRENVYLRCKGLECGYREECCR